MCFLLYWFYFRYRLDCNVKSILYTERSNTEESPNQWDVVGGQTNSIFQKILNYKAKNNVVPQPPLPPILHITVIILKYFIMLPREDTKLPKPETVPVGGIRNQFGYVGIYRHSWCHVVVLSCLINAALAFSTSSIESVMIVAACITSTIALNTLTGRQLIYVTIIGSIYVGFVLLTYYYVGTDNLFTLFVIYELFLLPSTLLVWLFSPNKRGAKTSLFFLLWTQFGSMMILIGVCLLRSTFGPNQMLSDYISNERTVLSGGLSVLCGFLVKIPTFPFYFWLVKTHVEVMTSFSIFLSGFLVKIALFGLYKFMFLFTVGVKLFAMVLAMVSAFITSVLFIFQLDLKKVVAYATIQEMGQLTAALFTMHLCNMRAISMFLLTHTVLSAKFFYLSDIMYRHHSSRSGLVVTGLLSTSPKLSAAVVLGLILFRGVPFSSKNSVEVNLLDVLFTVDHSFGLFWLFAVVLTGNLTFSFIFLRTLVFGTNQKNLSADLNHHEVLIFVAGTGVLIGSPYIFF